MVSKARIKYVKSLQVKKYRKQEQSFLVEGAKSVLELVQSDFSVRWLAASADFIEQYADRFPKHLDFSIATEKELAEMSDAETNDAALAVAAMREENVPTSFSGIALVLDDIRDPGNLGTIIRTADWYGIRQIIASPETADFYNPKTIRSTMGSFCRVQVQYTPLVPFLHDAKVPVYGAVMNGEDVHRVTFGKTGLIVIGNESNGISPDVMKTITHRITIPKVGGAESLNAAIATGVILDVMSQSKK